MNLGNVVAWVADVDEARGRAVALALSARGARVLVTGASERVIAECVGEIAHAGGKARHFVGDAGTEAGARACVAAARERFGDVQVAVVAGGAEGGEPGWAAAGFPPVATWGGAVDEGGAVDAVLKRLGQLLGS